MADLSGLEERLGACPAAGGSVDERLAQAVAVSLDRATIHRYPRALCVLCLHSPKSAGVKSVFRTLCSGGPLMSCAPTVVAAIHGGLSQPALRLGIRQLLRACARQLADVRAKAPETSLADDPCVRMVRAIACALSRHLSLDASTSEPALALLRDGLRVETPSTSRRSGIVVLEPLRRLAMLAAARAHAERFGRGGASDGAVDGVARKRRREENATEPAAARWPASLLAVVDLVSHTDVNCAEFDPVDAETLIECVAPTRCCYTGETFANDDADADVDGAIPVDFGLHALLPSRLRHLLGSANKRAEPSRSADRNGYAWAPSSAYLVSAKFGEIIAEADEMAAGGAPDAAADRLRHAMAADGGCDAERLAVHMALVDRLCSPSAQNTAAVADRWEIRMLAATLSATPDAPGLGLATWAGALSCVLVGAASGNCGLNSPKAGALGELLGVPFQSCSRAAVAADFGRRWRALALWWPCCLAALRRLRQHSAPLDRLLRRVAHLRAAAPHGGLCHDARLGLNLGDISAEVAYDLVRVSHSYLPCVLPLLQRGDARALLQRVALAVAPPPRGQPPSAASLVGALGELNAEESLRAAARCALALLSLPIVDAIGDADLVLAAHSRATLRLMYLPPVVISGAACADAQAGAVTPEARRERVATLTALVRRWRKRDVCCLPGAAEVDRARMPSRAAGLIRDELGAQRSAQAGGGGAALSAGGAGGDDDDARLLQLVNAS